MFHSKKAFPWLASEHRFAADKAAGVGLPGPPNPRRGAGGAGIVAGAVRNLDLICDASGRLKEWCGAFVVQNHQRRYLSIPQKMLPCLERVRFNYGPKDYVLHGG